MGVVGPAVDCQRGRAVGRGVRARARRLRPWRGPRGQGDRRPSRLRPARRRRGRALALRSRGRRGKEHPSSGARRARRRGNAAARGDRRSREAGALVRGREGPRVRERRAGRGGAGLRRAVKILLGNWNDRENPHAGGAEIHLHEIFGRLARWGHAIDLVTSGWPGSAAQTVLDGLRVQRVGGRHTFALRARGAVRRLLAASRYDVVVEDINKLPLYLPQLTERPFCAIVPHLFGTTAFAEASWPIATVVWAAERLIPRVYRRAAFHAISDSTRDDLVRRGVPRERIEVIYPGVDATWYSPDAATPRADEPTFLYVGRLKRYKGVETAVQALGLARQARPDMTLEIAGQGDDRARLERLVRALGLAPAGPVPGILAAGGKRRLLRRAWAGVFPSPKEGWGISNVEAAGGPCGARAGGGSGRARRVGGGGGGGSAAGARRRQGGAPGGAGRRAGGWGGGPPARPGPRRGPGGAAGGKGPRGTGAGGRPPAA